MEKLHHLNIIIHIIAGIIALIAGLLAVIVNKKNKRHVQFGKYFWWMIIFVIATGLISIFVFKRNNFLLVITLLSGYNCYSGIRVMRLAGKKPGSVDYIIPVIVMASAIYYLYYINTVGLYWSPVIIYSTIGALFLVTTYDLFKLIIPAEVLKKTVLYEHAYKMISALSAIASAFIGTIFPQYKPYSQFLPSVIGFSCIILTFIILSNKRSSLKKDYTLKQAN